MDKNTLRRLILAQRREIPSLKLREAGLLITSNIISRLDTASYDTILFYYPLPEEVSLLSLAQQALSVGKQAAFPRVHGQEMDFYLVTDLNSQFEEGSFHVMEPVTNEKADLSNAVCLVPGLAFDSHFQRLGYGKGYYDRFLAKHGQLMRIGICMNRFFLPSIPSEGRDVDMHWIVTENHVYRSR